MTQTEAQKRASKNYAIRHRDKINEYYKNIMNSMIKKINVINTMLIDMI